MTDSAISGFSGNSGVSRYDLEYGLTEDEITAVSDHYPVYAELVIDGDMD